MFGEYLGFREEKMNSKIMVIVSMASTAWSKTAARWQLHGIDSTRSVNIGRQILILLILGALLGFLTGGPSSAAVQQTTYTVDSNTNAADVNPGDGVCQTAGGHCTLHAAIQEANTHTGPQTIKFAHKFTGTNDIEGCGLPAIGASDLTIDGSDQWWITDDRPGVEIRGSGCILLEIYADRVIVMGLYFGGGGGSTGVYVDGCNGGNLIGGSGSRERNVFMTDMYGVRIGMNAGTCNYVMYNYFGTIDGDTPLGGFIGDTGILVESSNTVIYNNLIVGQSSAGIDVCNVGSVLVWENIIGVDKFRSSSMPNGRGIYVQGSAGVNDIGPDNTIAGNTGHGIELYHADNARVWSNDIGLGMGNGGDGIHVHLSYGVQIGVAPTNGNVISNNSGNGVWVDFYDVTVQSNAILDNDQDGVELGWGNSQIGGSGNGESNRISGNGGNGVHLNGTGGITVTGNTIGLDVGIFDHGNHGHGVLVNNGSVGNVIGGTGAGEGNWIAYNHGDGVRLGGSSTQDNHVVGNVIGAPANWDWEAPNHNHGVGIYNGAHDNWIGYTGGLSGGNTILANYWSGVAIVGSDDNAVLGNYIGTNGAAVNWGNAFYGVDVVDSSGTSIKENEIAYNGTAHGVDGAEAGVRVKGASATNNMISGNSIHDNDGPGIKLEDGGNNNLAAPVITSAGCGSPVEGTACANCWIEIYSDSDDEGRVYEGHFTTPPSGAITWSGTVNGPRVTALAIGPGSSKDTSPFSASFDVGPCNSAPTATFTVDPTGGYMSTVFSFDASGSSDAEDATTDLRVRWDWDGNGFYDTGWTTTKTASHSYPSVGTYTVRLEVMDTLGLKDTTTLQVSVSERRWVYLPLVLRNAP
jgi:parallel beta-helix repeat protein